MAEDACLLMSNRWLIGEKNKKVTNTKFGESRILLTDWNNRRDGGPFPKNDIVLSDLAQNLYNSESRLVPITYAGGATVGKD